jgi:hypothetical protein
MAVYVRRGGILVNRDTGERMALPEKAGALSSPRVSRFEEMESPVSGKTISSWRARDRDMDAAGACDPRDLPPPTKGRRPPDGK